jgi:hypothetical protein
LKLAKSFIASEAFYLNLQNLKLRCQLPCLTWVHYQHNCETASKNGDLPLNAIRFEFLLIWLKLEDGVPGETIP